MCACSLPSFNSKFFPNENEDFRREDHHRVPSRIAEDETRYNAFVIGVAGGTASGKTTVCNMIVEKLFGSKNVSHRVAIMSQDSFYKVLDEEQKRDAANYNFDHPTSLDFDLLENCVRSLKSKNFRVNIPCYDFSTHSRKEETVSVISPEVILVEGILVFAHKPLVDLMDLKIFVDTDADTCLVRRVRRDMAERGRSLESVLTQYERFVKPSFDEFIAPTKKFADIVIPRGADNLVAIDLVVENIRTKLHPRTSEFHSPQSASASSDEDNSCDRDDDDDEDLVLGNIDIKH